MGKWSQSVGKIFLDWLKPKPNLQWLDVGCGNGSFTELIFQRCAPGSAHGIDPSEAQLEFARSIPSLKSAHFQKADAMALPFPDNTFDVAVMPLVIFFVPDPAKGVAEMSRVVRPDGVVAAYGWDLMGGGFPYESLRAEFHQLGHDVPLPPNPDAARLETLRSLWTGAGLSAVETREIMVQRIFTDFDDYWETVLGGPSFRSVLSSLKPGQVALVKERMRAGLKADPDGTIICSARANAVKGWVN